MITEIIEKIQLRLPPNRDWTRQKQTEPPTYGWAKRVGQDVLDGEIAKRRQACKDILERGQAIRPYVPGKVAVIILSCCRWDPLQRLVESLRQFLEKVESYALLEKILVDNGSGPDLVKRAQGLAFFDTVVAHDRNLGLVGAMRDIYRRTDAEYIIFIEDDFILEYDKPFLKRLIRLFEEYPEIGIIRLKDQNNWWKPHRVIAPLRETSDGTAFWTWLPSRDGMLNGWAAGSVMFRKVSYFSVGELPEAEENVSRDNKLHQGVIYEYMYGKRFNAQWLAAKVKDGCVFVQPNDFAPSQGWGR